MEYSGIIQVVLLSLWAVGSLVLAWFLRRRLYVYSSSVALSVPAILSAQLGHGYLEMGGVLHALAAGIYALPFHYLFWRIRTQRC
jgi:hypothetical protein